jgi:hypothetical protein
MRVSKTFRKENGMKSYEIERIMRNHTNVEVVVKIENQFYSIYDYDWQGYINGGKLVLFAVNENCKDNNKNTK